MQRQHSSQASSTLGNTPNLNIGSQTKEILFEFALHPQHETSRDYEIQKEEDLKSKFTKQTGSLSMISLNSKDKRRSIRMLKVASPNGVNSKRMKLGPSNN